LWENVKPPAFIYEQARSVDEALDLLSRHENSKILAGGQSLMPMMNFRYVLPDRVIDINRIKSLADLRVAKDHLDVGAMVRQRTVEFSQEALAQCPLLSDAIPHIGHRQTRNRGTFGGSLAHSDPAAEIPTVATALDAVMQVASKRGSRSIPAQRFFTGYMRTALEPDELLTGIRLPSWPRGHGYAFVEFARRRGDFALASAAVLLVLGAQRVVQRISMTVAGLGVQPVRLSDSEKLLVGQPVGPSLVREAVGLAAGLEAVSDIHASAEYRVHLAQVLLARAFNIALKRAETPGHG
jgi:carbon-monoxide dehydrogenase medium subunit